MALGVTQQLPSEEKHNWTKDQLESRIAVCMGGRIAEDLTFGRSRPAPQNDIEQATEMARKMVCEWGMSESLGPLTYGKKEEASSSARSSTATRTTARPPRSRSTPRSERIVGEQYERAHRILTRPPPRAVK
jgi:cell division protease FtsH